ncbi:uncharacterized protein LOC141630875 [Silene latifolia]|uniref:uncharacterized protein LOC141630875 n=1 Tax=Silene latifolia TaxID=37657 RepID=UPI003D789122
MRLGYANIETTAQVALKHLHSVQLQLQGDPTNVGLQQAVKDANLLYKERGQALISFLAQKAKAHWMRDGDDNTQYFHSVIKARRMQNRILGIYDMDSQNHTTSADIEAAFINYYKHLLGTQTKVAKVHISIVQKGKVLNNEHKIRLIGDVTDTEIKDALFSVPADKAPGPDGYTSQFFKDSFDITGADLCGAVREFFTVGRMLKQVNATTLALIPKKDKPVTVADFRPIACCNVVYKIISKVICARLATVLPDIISENQSAFLKGRDIIDNILIWHDLVRLYKRKACSPRCLMKVDLKKAYDSVEWEFIREKSDIYFNGMCNEDNQYVIRVSGFREGSFPFTYLCIPISYKRMDVGDCSRLVERVVMRIRGWGARKLSYAGRLVLVQAVLSQLHSFWARIFLILVTVIDRIELICRNYLWSGSEEFLKTAPVAWIKVCTGKKSGGLGIINCKMCNVAMLGKYVWWLAMKADHLWIRWVNYMYIKDQHWMDYVPTVSSSWTWRKLCQVKEQLKPAYFNGQWRFNAGRYTISEGYIWLQGVRSKFLGILLYGIISICPSMRLLDG